MGNGTERAMNSATPAGRISEAMLAAPGTGAFITLRDPPEGNPRPPAVFTGRRVVLGLGLPQVLHQVVG